MASTKISLITGCSSGVGAALAAIMAQNGYCVYATMRSVNKLDELKKVCEEKKVAIDHFNAVGAPQPNQVRVRALDVTSDESVAKCVEGIYKDTNGVVDVLVNNAGYSLAGTLEFLSIEESRQQYETNFFGVLRITKAVLPGMRQRESGRVLGVSSMGGINGVPFNDVYCSSKFAMEGFFEAIAVTYNPFNVYFSLVEPGAIITSFIDNAKINRITGDEKADPSIAKFKALQEAYLNVMMQGFKSGSFGQTGDQVAQYMYDNVICAEKPNMRYQTNQQPVYQAAVKAKFTDPTGNATRDAYIQRYFGAALAK